jgi:hypothetical protein
VKVKRHTTWLTSDRWIDLDLVSHGHCAVAPTWRVQAGLLQLVSRHVERPVPQLSNQSCRPAASRRMLIVRRQALGRLGTIAVS